MQIRNTVLKLFYFYSKVKDCSGFLRYVTDRVRLMRKKTVTYFLLCFRQPPFNRILIFCDGILLWEIVLIFSVFSRKKKKRREAVISDYTEDESAPEADKSQLLDDEQEEARQAARQLEQLRLKYGEENWLR
jgi:hypothetical protein